MKNKCINRRILEWVHKGLELNQLIRQEYTKFNVH